MYSVNFKLHSVQFVVYNVHYIKYNGGVPLSVCSLQRVQSRVFSLVSIFDCHNLHQRPVAPLGV